jgi:ABC-type amino acid transport substrate-binding protein
MSMNTLVRAVLATVLSVSVIMPPDAYAGDTLAKIRERKSIIIAYRDSSLPFSYLDQKLPVGYAIDLCRKVADAVQRSLNMQTMDIKFVPVTPPTRIPTIVNGGADLECGSTTNNVERRQQVSFTIAHFVATVRMLVLKNSGITTWRDLRGKTVVSTKGTTPVKLMTSLNENSTLGATIKLADDHAQSFKMLEAGKADAFVMDDVLLYGLRARSAQPERYTVVGSALSAEPYAIMIRKDDPDFKRVVDREIARLAQEGEMQRMYAKWFVSPIPPSNINLQMPMGTILREMLLYPSDKVGD